MPRNSSRDSHGSVPRASASGAMPTSSSPSRTASRMCSERPPLQMRPPGVQPFPRQERAVGARCRAAARSTRRAARRSPRVGDDVDAAGVAGATSRRSITRHPRLAVWASCRSRLGDLSGDVVDVPRRQVLVDRQLEHVRAEEALGLRQLAVRHRSTLSFQNSSASTPRACSATAAACLSGTRIGKNSGQTPSGQIGEAPASHDRACARPADGSSSTRRRADRRRSPAGRAAACDTARHRQVDIVEVEADVADVRATTSQRAGGAAHARASRICSADADAVGAAAHALHHQLRRVRPSTDAGAGAPQRQRLERVEARRCSARAARRWAAAASCRDRRPTSRRSCRAAVPSTSLSSASAQSSTSSMSRRRHRSTSAAIGCGQPA